MPNPWAAAWHRRMDDLRWNKHVARAYLDTVNIDNWSIHNRTHAQACSNILTAALRILEKATPDGAKYLVRQHGLSKPELRTAIERLSRYLGDLPADPYARIDEKFVAGAEDSVKRDEFDRASERLRGLNIGIRNP